MKIVILGAIALTFTGTVAAANIEAERYIGAQGIEIIHNRGIKPVPDEKAAPDASNRPQKSSVNTKAIVPAMNNPLAQESKLRISSKEQSALDNDRLAILNQELMTEAATFQTKWKALHSANLKTVMSEEEIVKLQLSVAEHEKNIRALSAEIKRAQGAK